MTCPVLIGFILVRPCGAPTTTLCESCRREICAAHARTRSAAPAVYTRCVECLRTTTTTDVYITSPDPISTSSGSSDSQPDVFAGGGGTFGGAGASGGWDDAAPDASAAATPGAFTPADFAAFDAISESDKDQGSPGYDS